MDVTNYLEVISLIERLHREFLELVKLELERLRLRDVSNVQALMLFNIGDAEMTVGELTSRGCYLGSNVSYNVKKLVESGYLEAERSAHDLRSINVKLSDAEIADRLKTYKPPSRDYPRGYNRLFAQHVRQANEGCDFDFLVGKSGSAVPRDNH